MLWKFFVINFLLNCCTVKLWKRLFFRQKQTNVYLCNMKIFLWLIIILNPHDADNEAISSGKYSKTTTYNWSQETTKLLLSFFGRERQQRKGKNILFLHVTNTRPHRDLIGSHWDFLRFVISSIWDGLMSRKSWKIPTGNECNRFKFALCYNVSRKEYAFRFKTG